MAVTKRRNTDRIEHAAKLISREVSFFNGWWVDEDTKQKACEDAARKVIKYMERRNRG